MTWISLLSCLPTLSLESLKISCIMTFCIYLDDSSDLSCQTSSWKTRPRRCMKWRWLNWKVKQSKNWLVIDTMKIKCGLDSVDIHTMTSTTSHMRLSSCRWFRTWSQDTLTHGKLSIKNLMRCWSCTLSLKEDLTLDMNSIRDNSTDSDLKITKSSAVTMFSGIADLCFYSELARH